ncbi:MAG: flagellar basal body rod C-terminal domain-containing protein [Ilumatobacter sp.]|uniref:flagellar basal body rod protein FlgC n=1 Tax=Ilumatobacter sp. TaxID=1967498 RepID=UPI00261E7B8F|nr:flagellar basal body rod C-terminal domain-containing protein [Ilumatobacter sp.]MDJ0767455.1 flagellar basal body rod C-terminal domain-containing protein [Ilumatobacter sp.]
MSAVFATLGVARSGMGAYKLWLDAVADNVANIDNVTSTDQEAFKERFVLVTPARDASGDGAGVRVAGSAFGDPNGRVMYEPNHPLADDNGMVRRPDIDLADQMVYMQLAQRGYQANINAFERAREAYEAAISIGQ